MNRLDIDFYMVLLGFSFYALCTVLFQLIFRRYCMCTRAHDSWFVMNIYFIILLAIRVILNVQMVGAFSLMEFTFSMHTHTEFSSRHFSSFIAVNSCTIYTTVPMHTTHTHYWLLMPSPSFRSSTIIFHFQGFA